MTDEFPDPPAMVPAVVRAAPKPSAIGTGLRTLHAAFPVASCPFSWSAADRLADARRKAAAGQLDPEGWHEVHGTSAHDRARDSNGR